MLRYVLGMARNSVLRLLCLHGPLQTEFRSRCIHLACLQYVAFLYFYCRPRNIVSVLITCAAAKSNNQSQIAVISQPLVITTVFVASQLQVVEETWEVIPSQLNHITVEYSSSQLDQMIDEQLNQLLYLVVGTGMPLEATSTVRTQNFEDR